MGLQIGELDDIAYDSIPILLLTIIAASIRNLRATVINFIRQIHSLKLGSSSPSQSLDFGLSTLISVAEHLKLLNLIAAFSNSIDELNGCSDDIDCVVCLCNMRKGERLRKLECGHMFHKKCLDEWLKQLHFTCPLCRSPVSTVVNSKSKMDSGSFKSVLVSWFRI